MSRNATVFDIVDHISMDIVGTTLLIACSKAHILRSMTRLQKRSQRCAYPFLMKPIAVQFIGKQSQTANSIPFKITGFTVDKNPL